MKATAKTLQQTIKAVCNATGATTVFLHESGHVSAELNGAYLKMAIAGCSAAGKKRAALPADILIQAVGATGECTLEIGSESVTVQHGRSKAALTIEQREYQPVLVDPGTQFKSIQSALIDLLPFINLSDIHATESVGNLHLRVKDGKLTAARFDHYHLALATRKVKSSLDLDITAPAAVFTNLFKLSETPLVFEFLPNMLKAKSDTLEYQTPLLEARKDLTLDTAMDVFHRLKSKATVTCDKDDLLSVLSRARVLFDQQGGAKMVVQKNRVSVQSGNEYGKVKADCDAKVRGSFETLIHPDLTADTLNAMPTKTVTLEFDENMAWSRVVVDGTTFQYIILYVS